MPFNSHFIRGSIFAGFFAAFIALGHGEDEQPAIALHGFGSMQVGQLVKYKYQSQDFSGRWMQENRLGLGIDAILHPRLSLYLRMEGALSYNTMPDTALQRPTDNILAPLFGINPDRAEMVLNLSPESEDSVVRIGIGIFPYKYNREARNLGEYLFRSGCYPGFIDQEGFDWPQWRLAGLRLENNLFGFWRNEFMITSELYLPPFNDLSIALLSDVSVARRALNLGAGIQFYRAIPMDDFLTTPKMAKRGGLGARAPNYFVDSMTNDTTFYTFAGAKLMGRFAFDVKRLFNWGMFGKEDLKLYGEAVILGIKNYPPNLHTDDMMIFVQGQPLCEFGYNKLLQKTPIMAGINIPAFKLLDVISFEWEYYGKKYVNAVPLPGHYDPFYPSTQTPKYPSNPEKGRFYDSTGFYKSGEAQFKWSFYAKKTLFKRFTITVQLARDHIRTNEIGLMPINFDMEEALVRNQHWYWRMKFASGF